MSAVPGDLDAENQPPMTIPLRHFLVGLGFLLGGTVLGIADYAGFVPGLARLAHVHLLLIGWVCITIMGAMTQFVPVWSGATLYSDRLAAIQLWLVAGGLVGFAGTFLAGPLAWLPVFGLGMLLGFWIFVYNVARTLSRARPFDVTERHFALALGYLLLVTFLGFTLALDFPLGVYPTFGIDHAAVVATHGTLAVFGVILTAVFGALYQLATMFTQSGLHGVDHHLRRVEEFGYPAGTILLAIGRLVGSPAIGRIGGELVVLAVLAFSVVLTRRLVEMQVAWTPMHRRYALLTIGLVAWGVTSAVAWIDDPLSQATLFGTSGVSHLLVVGVVSVVVVGTLYHVVPFIVWVHRYSDQLGLEPVPMIDDLYDDRIALADFVLLIVGTTLLVAGSLVPGWPALFVGGGVLLVLSFLAFSANVVLVVRRHSPQTIRQIVLGTSSPPETADSAESVSEAHESD